ncbi:uncharacterized protein LOC116342569 [Contarinia nasturtii]|uniref:uncharacterized protein LOC116342569 n=1 Tax=Contarinia nasturtii TaxID=265458 RepID=UPI0012D385C0|nr:uncharacterized protein LOC116342569 [Contarinia nasturtii]
MKKRTFRKMYSQFAVGLPKVWADEKAFKLIKAMRSFPILRSSFGKQNTKGGAIERAQLESILGCPIKEIARKWKTLCAYYNKLITHGSELKQQRWRFFKEMSITMSIDNNTESNPSNSNSLNDLDEFSIENGVDFDTFFEHKDDIPAAVDDEANNRMLFNHFGRNDGDLLSFKLADIAMRFGIEKRNMVESQMLNLCISLEKKLVAEKNNQYICI